MVSSLCFYFRNGCFIVTEHGEDCKSCRDCERVMNNYFFYVHITEFCVIINIFVLTKKETEDETYFMERKWNQGMPDKGI